MTPKTINQNLLLWSAALGVSVVLAFLTGVATHWPEGGSIDWRGVTLDVVQVLLSVIPVVAAGIGLPRLGKEGIASLVNEVGAPQAKAALEVEAIKQQTGVSGSSVPTVAEIADELERRRQARVEGRLKQMPGGRQT